jgi:segregation and condensation protein B
MSANATESVQTNPESETHQPAGSPIEAGKSVESVDLESILPGIEAMLVSSDRPLKSAGLIDALAVHLDRTITTKVIEEAIARLNALYDAQGRAFRIEGVSGGYRLMTRSEHAPIVAAMHRSRATTRLSKPALETLSIIAYRQPITRAELESIRGVACGEVVRTLMDRRLVKITGRAEELGRPMLYGTTRQFLDTFGLASVKDLPKPEELADQMEQSN